MGVVLAGNNAAAVCVLDLLLEHWSPDDLLCLAPPAKERADWHVAVGLEAAARNVEVIQPEDVNDGSTIARIRSLEPSLLLSVYYTQVFGTRLLDVVPGPCINLHPSLLPKHRGVAPLIWAIVDGDTTTGVTAHVIDRGIDTGSILLQRRLPIHRDDTGASLHDKATRLVTAMCAELIRAHRSGVDLSLGRPQTGLASYRDRRVPSVNHISWTDSRERIRNIVRALAPPLPGAFAQAGESKVVIGRVEPDDLKGRRPWRPGALSLREEVPLVWAGDGPLQLLTVDLLDGNGLVPGSAIVRVPGVYEGSLLT